MRSVAGVVLAAGGSRRLGRPKQLVSIEGTTLLRRATELLCLSRCRPVAVVLGASVATIGPSVCDMPIEIIFNANWQDGLASSIGAATRWARSVGADGLLLSVCDQPKLNTAHIDALVSAYQGGAEMVASRYAEKRGVPALFDSAWFDQLEALRGDAGACALLRAQTDVFEVDWPDGATDIDTGSDVARLLARIALGSNGRG